MKVFGIGLNKTGTTTLGSCFRTLGFRHHSFSLDLLESAACGEMAPLLQILDAFDSFEDWPYPLFYRFLDRLYPGSRFVLTRRSTPARWLASLGSHALRTDPLIGSRTRSLAYGCPFPQLNPKHFLSFYANHLNQVRSYFQDRPQDLLEVCWEEQASWEPLCAFLERPIPDCPFPHENASRRPDKIRLHRNTTLIRWYRRQRSFGHD
jgi:hypothetical protein